VGTLGSSRSFIVSSSFFLRLWDRCGLFDSFGDFPSVTNNVRPTQGGAAAAARRRQGVEVENEGLLKDLVVIFIFLRCFVLFVVFLMSESYSQKKNNSFQVFFIESFG
jgi:hypothetical protein